jgi:hypothetical protein
MAIFSKEDLERIKQTQVEPGPRPGGTNAIVNQVLPLAPVARKPAVYSLDDERPIAEPAKTEPVAPKKKKKIVRIDSNAGTRTVEYVDADETGIRRSE